MRVALTISLVLFGPSLAHAQHAGAFARMGFGARGMGMGNAIIADASGYASPYYNPALAPYLAGQSLDVSAALMTLDRQLQFLQLSTPLRPRAGIAGGLIHAGVGNFDGRDASGYHTGTFATDEFAFFIAFGLKVGSRATVGAGLALFRSDLFANVAPARSIGVDLGMTFRVTEQLRLGAVVDDLLASYSWDTSKHHSAGGNNTDVFPKRIRIGASYQLPQVSFAVEYESRFTTTEARRRSVELVGGALRELIVSEDLMLHETRFRAGAEYQLVPALAIRGGATTVAQGALRPSAGFSVQKPLGGVAVRAAYAFILEPFALGTMHLVTLRFYL